jgi:hypothetical protein
MLSGISGHSAQVIQEKLFYDHIANLVGSTVALTTLTVGRADQMLFLMFPAPCTDLVHLAATIRTIHHAGECGHFAHWSKSASAITDTLNNIKCFLIYDGFMRTLENLPFVLIVFDLLFQLIGLLSAPVIKCKKTPIKKCRFPAERDAI